VKREGLCLSFDSVKKDDKVMCVWKLGMRGDEPMAETIIRLCERQKCNGAFEQRPSCAAFADDGINEHGDLLLIVEKKE
jgi:hypothetical protein